MTQAAQHLHEWCLTCKQPLSGQLLRRFLYNGQVICSWHTKTYSADLSDAAVADRWSRPSRR